MTQKKTTSNKIDEHVCCPSYPVCDDAPLGCLLEQGIDNVEWYGHKDNCKKKGDDEKFHS